MKIHQSKTNDIASKSNSSQPFFPKNGESQNSFFQPKTALSHPPSFFSGTETIQRKDEKDKPTNELVKVSSDTKSPLKISNAIVEDFESVIEEVKKLTGQDLGEQPGDAHREMSSTTTKVGADNFSWHKTGRAIDLNQGFKWLILKEDKDESTYFRLYLKKSTEEASQYDKKFVKSSPPTISGKYDNPYGDNIYKLTFIDVTQILEEKGFARIKAQKGWENVSDKREWWHYEQRDNLNMYEALRQIYSEQKIMDSYKKLATKSGILRMYREGFPVGVLEKMASFDVQFEINKFEFNNHFKKDKYKEALSFLVKMKPDQIKSILLNQNKDKLKSLRAEVVVETIFNPELSKELIKVFGQILINLPTEGVKKESEPKVFINPTSNQINIEFQEKVAQEIKVEIFDVLGNIKKPLTAMTTKSGKNLFTIDVSPYPSGLYFVKIQTSKEIYTKKITKAK